MVLVNFFVSESVSLYVTSVGLSIILYGPIRSGCNFLEIFFLRNEIGY